MGDFAFSKMIKAGLSLQEKQLRPFVTMTKLEFSTKSLNFISLFPPQ
jgi:hypothetical protein